MLSLSGLSMGLGHLPKARLLWIADPPLTAHEMIGPHCDSWDSRAQKQRAPLNQHF